MKKSTWLIIDLVNLLLMISWWVKPVNVMAESYIAIVTLVALVVDLVVIAMWMKNRIKNRPLTK